MNYKLKAFLITLLVAGSQPGLQVLKQDNTWMDVSTSKDYIVINVEPDLVYIRSVPT